MKLHHPFLCSGAKKTAGCITTVFYVLLLSFVADAVEVTNEFNLSVSATGTTIVSGARKADVSFPSDISGVIFRFDANNRIGWEIANGKITKIPSLVGDGRYLSVEHTQWNGWGNTQVESPTLLENLTALNGGAAVDFGATKSKRALIFDPSDDGNAMNAKTNALFNVGTVCMVYDSTNGGGWLLGGGYRLRNGYTYHRGDPTTNGSDPDSYIFRTGSNAATEVQNGRVYQDGRETVPTLTGLSGGWSTVILQPTAAVLDVTGLGLNDGRYYTNSGGMRIAEAIFYNRLLTEGEIRRVEAYLAKKWFGRETAGFGGCAKVERLSMTKTGPVGSFAVTTAADVGESLSVGEFAGGRGGSTPELIKTGAGKVALADAAGFSGKINVTEGTLDFVNVRTVPASLPPGMRYHLDGSATAGFSSERSDLGEFLTVVSNLTTFTHANGPITFRPDAAIRPEVLRDALGAGLHVFDFGAYGSKRYLKLYAGESVAENDRAFGVMTVLAVVNARHGGGHLVTSHTSTDSQSPFLRADKSKVVFSTGLVDPNAAEGAGARAQVWVDGLEQSPEVGYPTPDWHVVALSLPARYGYFTRIGSPSENVVNLPYTGGFMLGEFVAYARPLSETEIRDGMAYLAKKWLARTLPGYANDASAPAPSAGTVETSDGVGIGVASGKVALRSLYAAGTLTKSGSGTLEVQGDAQLAELSITGGKLRFAPGDDLTIDSFAVRPVLHLDASDISSFDLVESDGKSFVQCWHDLSGANAAYAYDSTVRPWLETGADKLVNGHAFVNFGDIGKSNGGKTLSLVRSLNSVRAAFILWGTQNNGAGGFLLGSSSKNGDANGSYYDFHREGAPSDCRELIATSMSAISHVAMGTILTNGVVSGNVIPPTGCYNLIEVYPIAPAHVSALAGDRDYNDRLGGQRLCEVLLYDRDLTDREKTATRNYLMHKWLGTPSATSVARVPNEVSLKQFTDAERGKVEIADGVNVAVEKLVALDGFEKDTDGILSFPSFLDVTGVVNVTKGTLRTTASWVGDDVLVPAPDDVLLHFDATQGLKAATNGNIVTVSEWASVNGNGWVARPASTGKPTYAENGLNGRPTVNMALNDKQAFYFYNGDQKAEMTGIKSVFWVIGSQEYGGFVLGGSTYDWHRGSDNMSKLEFILSSNAADPIERGDWRLNGNAIDPKKTTLSGGWDILDMNVQEGNTAKANGLAMDGRSDSWCDARMGGQRLAEVIICNRTFSDDERVKISNYLKKKWFGSVGGVPKTDLNLGAVATLDTAGNVVAVRTVAGDGFVTGGGTLKVMDRWSVGVDGATGAADCLSVADGTKVSFSPDARLTVSFTSEPVADRVKYRILSATSLESAEILRAMKIDVTGLPYEVRATLLPDSQGVVLNISRGGLVLIVR